MLIGNKNLKDPSHDLEITLKDSPFPFVYPKANKLITALYMVTDIVDKEEPLRNKLRTLGVEILSDTISGSRSNLDNKIQEIVSFLDIASAVNLISEMNCNILKKEFLDLSQHIKESTQTKPAWLEEFIYQSSPERSNESSRVGIGHTRIGVQKGGTLMKALSGVKDIHKNNPAPYEARGFHAGFDLLKKQRREDIVRIIKTNGGSATIKDIKTKTSLSYSEKTLQRELMSMIKDSVLYKEGSKRWSRYFIRG